MRYKDEHHKACIDMLLFHGINAKDIPADDGVTAYGYSTWARGEDGNKIVRDNAFVLNDEIAWPKSFPVKSFFEHYWSWKGAVV